MQTLNDEVREWLLPAGSVVKVDGIPYTLASEAAVLGAMPPIQVVSQAVVGADDCQQPFGKNP